MHCSLKFQLEMLNFSFSPLLLLILENAAGTDVFMQMKLLSTNYLEGYTILTPHTPSLAYAKGLTMSSHQTPPFLNLDLRIFIPHSCNTNIA